MLGPAYVTPRLLDSTGLKLSDISVFELHEAFAGQVLANLRALESDYFCRGEDPGVFVCFYFGFVLTWNGCRAHGKVWCCWQD